MNQHYSTKERAHIARVKQCSVDGCSNVHLARGYCQNHYMRLRRADSELVKPIKNQSDIEYIELRIKKTESGCWEWQKSKFAGYGRLIRHGRTWPAHAFSYVAHGGEIPIGMQINHRCHNRACVNPDHLYAGTQQQNMADMKEAGRDNYLRGEADGNSKITSEIAMRIFSASGIAREIAKEFGVSISLVYAIRKKQIWKHIHEPAL